MPLLALILFLPWFAVLGFVFVWFPRAPPRSRGCRLFEMLALAFALLLSAWAARWALGHDWGRTGPIWPQVAAVLFAYAGWLLMLLAAAGIRQRWFLRGVRDA